MNLRLDGRNLYIVNKKPQTVVDIEVHGEILFLKNDKGVLLENSEINLKKDIYACLFCRQLKNITLIVKGKNVFSGALILADDVQFEAVLDMIKKEVPELELHEQNAKINGYAASVVEKLLEGTNVAIMETKEVTVKCCSVCGMECDPNIPYCMECGAAV